MDRRAGAASVSIVIGVMQMQIRVASGEPGSSRTFFFGGRKGKEGLQLMKSGKSLPISFVRLLAGMRG
jgi:hypothetical protein